MVAYSDTRKIANKIIDIFSDNKVLDSEWYYSVPMYVVQTALPVLININNFNLGIEHNMGLYQIRVPEDKLFPARFLGDRPTEKDWKLFDAKEFDDEELERFGVPDLGIPEEDWGPHFGPRWPMSCEKTIKQGDINPGVLG